MDDIQLPTPTRTYERHDIEAVLGKALTRARGQDIADGLDPEQARAAVLELAGPLGLDQAGVLEAFEDEADEARRARQWLQQLARRPSVKAIARHLVQRIQEQVPDVHVRVRRCQRAIPGVGTLPAYKVQVLRQISPGVSFLGIPIRSASHQVLADLTVVAGDDRTWVLGTFDDRPTAEAVTPSLLDLRDRLEGPVDLDGIRLDVL